jgi:hypothetical protein
MNLLDRLRLLKTVGAENGNLFSIKIFEYSALPANGGP